jgi:hypothetical protein
MPDSLWAIEHCDDRLRRAREIAECCNNWFADDHAAFAKRYVKGDLKLVFRRVDIDPREYGIVFEARPNGAELQPMAKSFGRPNYRAGDDFHAYETSVFAGHVEIMQCEEQIIPSTIRFQRFDSDAFTLGQPLFVFYPIYGVDKVIEGSEKGKVSFSARRYAIASSERRSKQIETTAGAVYDSADLGINEIGKWRIDSQFEELLPNLRVKLLDQIIRVSVKPGSESLLKPWEVG